LWPVSAICKQRPLRRPSETSTPQVRRDYEADSETVTKTGVVMVQQAGRRLSLGGDVEQAAGFWRQH
jgi:hypothetical protein